MKATSSCDFVKTNLLNGSADPPYHNALFETKWRNRNSGKPVAMKKHEAGCPPQGGYGAYTTATEQVGFLLSTL